MTCWKRSVIQRRSGALFHVTNFERMTLGAWLSPRDGEAGMLVGFRGSAFTCSLDRDKLSTC
jgi:hypothetical protein